jgi:hypothetical protein
MECQAIASRLATGCFFNLCVRVEFRYFYNCVDGLIMRFCQQTGNCGAPTSLWYNSSRRRRNHVWVHYLIDAVCVLEAGGTSRDGYDYRQQSAVTQWVPGRQVL